MSQEMKTFSFESLLGVLARTNAAASFMCSHAQEKGFACQLTKHTFLYLPGPLKAMQAPTGVLQLPMLQVTLRLPAKPGLQLTMHTLPLAVPGQY
jgi:hypothetical protein